VRRFGDAVSLGYLEEYAVAYILAIGTKDAAGTVTYFQTMNEVFQTSFGPPPGVAGGAPIVGRNGVDARLMLVIGIENGFAGAQAAYDFLMAYQEPNFADRTMLNFLAGNIGFGPGWAIDLQETAPVFFQLTVNKDGNGSGAVSSNPSGIDCGADCSESYTAGTNVTLSAIASAGSVFAGWSGACTGKDNCTVTMSEAKSVTATFNLQTFTVAVNKNGDGSGTVTSNEAGIYCGSVCSATFYAGTIVTAYAVADGNSVFGGWSGDGTCNGSGICSFTVNSNINLTATFSRSWYTLTVGKTGEGKVQSDPEGINCGHDCSEKYPAGTTVTLRASGQSGYELSYWYGACAGKGRCTITINNDTFVGAYFEKTKPGKGRGK
jgi:hypothetical protein